MMFLSCPHSVKCPQWYNGVSMTDRPLKILHLTTHLNIGGITTYIIEIASAFEKNGHSVAVLSSGGEMQERLAEKGVSVHPFPIRTKNILSPRLFLALPKIVKLVRRERFDLLHAHSRVTQALASFVSFFTKVPFVSTSHGFYKRHLGRRLFPSWGKCVIAISPLVAEELEKMHKVHRSRVRIICNAIDIPAYRKRLLEKNPAELRRKLGIPENSFVIGCVSRLVRDKGQEYLIEAVARLRKKHSRAFLLMAGDGREKGRLESLIRKMGLANNALLLPSDPDATTLYSVMDVFAHPVATREGFGLAMLEAMVAKIPVVASDVWAINSILRNHVNGFLVPPKNPAEIETALCFILENPEIAGSVAQNAFETANRSYSMERMVAELETVYGEVVGAR